MWASAEIRGQFRGGVSSFYHWFRESNSRFTWQTLYLLNHLGAFGVIVVKGFSCISGAKFSVRWHHGMNKDHFREWAHSKTTLGKKGMNSGSAQVYLSAVSDGDCMVALQSGSWGCSCVQSPLPSLRNNEARFLLSDIHSASLLVEY